MTSQQQQKTSVKHSPISIVAAGVVLLGMALAGCATQNQSAQSDAGITTVWSKMQQSGDSAMEQGNTGQAAAQFEAAVAEAESEHSDQHLLTSLRKLADAYYAQGKIFEAEKIDARAQQLRGTAQTGDADGSRIANLAQSCHKRGQCEIAENLFKKAVQISTAAFGDESKETAERIGELAQFYKEMGQPEKAGPLVKKAIDIKGSLDSK